MTAGRHHIAVSLLVGGWCTLDGLVGDTALPLGRVEKLVAAIGPDIEQADGRLRIRPAVADLYREMVPRGGARDRRALWGGAQSIDGEAIARLERALGDASPAKPALDQVAATVDTLVRRARVLSDSLVLDGADVLFLGDHDRTSLAFAAEASGASPMRLAVVDIDDDVLEHIERGARWLPGSVALSFADFRNGLAPHLEGWADLVFTDPPYTPEGIQLFLRTALIALRRTDGARIVLAYGYGDQPGLGLAVQREIQRLNLVFEAVLPDFNRYHGALAIGSSSALYVLRPTRRSFKLAEQLKSGDSRIYTHGPQSRESRPPVPVVDETTSGALGALVDHVHLAVSPERWPRADVTIGIGELLRSRPTASPFPGVGEGGGAGGGAVADLRGRPSPVLLRVLLALNVGTAAVLVPSHNEYVSSQRGQQALTRLFETKFRFRFRRSSPGPSETVVEARRVPVDELNPDGVAARTFLEHPYALTRNAWLEGMRAALRSAGFANLQRRELKAAIETRFEASILECPVVHLPRFALELVVDDIGDYARTLTDKQ